MYPPCQRVPIPNALEYAGTVPYSNIPSPIDPLSPVQRTLFPIYNTAAPSPIYRPHARRDRSLDYTLGPDDTQVQPALSYVPSDPPLVPTSHVNDTSFTRDARYAFPSPFHAQQETPNSFLRHSASQQFPLPPLSSLGLPQVPRAHSNPSLSSSFGANLISHVEIPSYQGEQVPDAEAFLREQFSIPPNVPVNLDALPDPPPGVRPDYTNSQLARLAIYGHPQHRATLHQLLKAIEDRFDWYKKEKKSWRGSIRHLLSLESLYVKVERQKTDRGSGSYWTLDVRNPKGMKRPRKRTRHRSNEQKSNPYPTLGAMKMDISHIAPRGSASPERCNSVASSQSSAYSQRMDSPGFNDGYFQTQYDVVSSSWNARSSSH
ncbi:uncharacterized protein EV420DRAFT_973442 [Desarmillaria tabescens]|uniref:Fork-head domain-containing protein n=1 Tax=Armillaria tabescens TaxID=1929756 RepID=A0AA39JM74_ARMTA|nr:uncharacterized protein EV420DRAFT_973442 [Desarmillaria tabescens]KAK0445341.1 hypothetical protein EV420DRAFT_973442 [Desarmillaria tabescens]